MEKNCKFCEHRNNGCDEAPCNQCGLDCELWERRKYPPGTTDINDIKQDELREIGFFICDVEDDGQVFRINQALLDEPFDKIMDGIKKIRRLMRESGEKNLKH